MTRPSGTERHRQNCCRSWTKRISLIFFFLCYVFLGAYVFLIIESQQDTTNNDPAVQKHHHTPPTEEIRTASFDLSDEDDRLQKLQYEAMTRQALEKLWDITENLNILYKDNWTRLASEEMGRLHDSMHLLMKKECVMKRNNKTAGQLGSNKAETVQIQTTPAVKWTYPAAFLYTLSVMTTLGSGPIIPESMEGKLLTIFYAIVGIPLLLSYLSVTASILSSCFRCCRLSSTSKNKKSARMADGYTNNHNDLTYAYPSTTQHKVMMVEEDLDASCQVKMSCWPVVFIFTLILVYILAAALFLSSTVPLPWMDALWLSFMLFTTTGIPTTTSGPVAGLFTSNRGGLLIAVSVYVLIGLTLCALCFNLVYEWLISRWTFARSDGENTVSSVSSRRSSSQQHN